MDPQQLTRTEQNRTRFKAGAVYPTGPTASTGPTPDAAVLTDHEASFTLLADESLTDVLADYERMAAAPTSWWPR